MRNIIATDLRYRMLLLYQLWHDTGVPLRTQA